jgi:hypothetical protein
MIKPTILKEWSFVKTQKNDIASLIQKGLRPDEYYYQCNDDVYTPVIRIADWEEYLKTKKI